RSRSPICMSAEVYSTQAGALALERAGALLAEVVETVGLGRAVGALDPLLVEVAVRLRLDRRDESTGPAVVLSEVDPSRGGRPQALLTGEAGGPLELGPVAHRGPEVRAIVEDVVGDPGHHVLVEVGVAGHLVLVRLLVGK